MYLYIFRINIVYFNIKYEKLLKPLISYNYLYDYYYEYYFINNKQKT